MPLKKESEEVNEMEDKSQNEKHDFRTGEKYFSCIKTEKTSSTQ